MLALALSPGSPTAIYAQIADQVACAIRAGQLSPGDALPSVREVAQRLTVNPNTVVKAYAHLEAAGLIRGLPGRGFVVQEPRAVHDPAELDRRLEEALTPLVSGAARYGWDRARILAALKRRFDQEGLP